MARGEPPPLFLGATGSGSLLHTTRQLGAFLDREQGTFVRDVQGVIGTNRGAVDRIDHLVFGQDIQLLRQFEHGDVTVFVADVNLPINDQHRSPRSGEHVVRPIDGRLAVLGFLRIQAVDQAGKICDEQQIILNCRAADRAVHRFFEFDLAILVAIDRVIVPDRPGIRIRDGFFTLLGVDTLQASWRNFFPIGANRQFQTDVTTLVGVQAVVVADPFPVFWVFTDSAIYVRRVCR